MARKKGKGTELSVFKGREAKLNRAIFQELALEGPQNIYTLHKNLRKIRGFKQVHYGNVNKRTRALEQTGYLKTAKIENTKAGFEAAVYELTARTYLALMLDSISLENLLNRIDEDSATEILATIAGFSGETPKCVKNSWE
jgi:DNA-binding PadR family transcriptional regulator